MIINANRRDLKTRYYYLVDFSPRWAAMSCDKTAQSSRFPSAVLSYADSCDKSRRQPWRVTHTDVMSWWITSPPCLVLPCSQSADLGPKSSYSWRHQRPQREHDLPEGSVLNYICNPFFLHAPRQNTTFSLFDLLFTTCVAPVLRMCSSFVVSGQGVTFPHSPPHSHTCPHNTPHSIVGAPLYNMCAHTNTNQRKWMRERKCVEWTFLQDSSIYIFQREFTTRGFNFASHLRSPNTHPWK